MASCYSGATASAVRFRYTGRFFSIDRFQDEDIQFIIRHLELSITVETFRANYPSAVVYQHRSVILDKLGYYSFESKKSEFDYELGRLVAKRLRPKQIFYQMIRYLKAHRIVLPTAHFLVNAITYAFRHFEERLRDSLRENLREEDIILLEELLEDMASEASRIYRISRLKRVNQNIQPSRIRASLEDFTYKRVVFPITADCRAAAVSRRGHKPGCSSLSRAVDDQGDDFPTSADQ